ncbi:hypothetical protein D3C72_2187040 [compost metagenome]
MGFFTFLSTLWARLVHVGFEVGASPQQLVEGECITCHYFIGQHGLIVLGERISGFAFGNDAKLACDRCGIVDNPTAGVLLDKEERLVPGNGR